MTPAGSASFEWDTQVEQVPLGHLAAISGTGTSTGTGSGSGRGRGRDRGSTPAVVNFRAHTHVPSGLRYHRHGEAGVAEMRVPMPPTPKRILADTTVTLTTTDRDGSTHTMTIRPGAGAGSDAGGGVSRLQAGLVHACIAQRSHRSNRQQQLAGNMAMDVVLHLASGDHDLKMKM